MTSAPATAARRSSVSSIVAPVCLRVRLRPGDDLHVRAVALGRAAGHVHAGLGADLGERVGDVVAVADVDEPHALEAPDVLAHGERVGHRLAGVVRVGEAVDHRDLAVVGEVLDVLLGEGADHDAVDVAAHHVGGVLDGLPDAQLDVVGVQEHGLGAELLDPDLEAHARARTGLHEHHGDGAAGEEGMRHAPPAHVLELGGEVEQGDDLGGGEVADGEEAAAGEVELGEVTLCLLGHGTPFGRRVADSPRKRRGGGRTHLASGPRRCHAALTPEPALR